MEQFLTSHGSDVKSVRTPFGDPGFFVLAGSRLYGIDTPTSDYDFVGAIVEPVNYRVGLMKHKEARGDTQNGFEQYQFKGEDYEGTIYSLWKLARMFSEGNPTILCLMFGTPTVDRYGICTEEFRSLVRSKHAGKRFLRYMQSQRKSMLDQRSKHVTRRDLIDIHGFDTKFAGHVIRLGLQGVEYLDTGHVTLPMRDECVDAVRAIRNGEVSLDDVVALSWDLERDLLRSLETSTLPEEPDVRGLSDWVVDRYQKSWISS